MNRFRWLLILAAFALLTTTCQAGTVLSVRLVEASNSGTGSSKGMGDIVPILKRSLPFANHRLLSSCSVRLPSSGDKSQMGEYELICRGAQNALSITVSRGDRVMLTTQVNLQDRTPLVLGGFPSAIGKHVMVFVAR